MNTTDILYIDPDQVQRQHFHNCLTRFGFNITLAANGESALKLVVNSAFSVIILDRSLPDASLDKWFGRLRRTVPDAIFLVVGEQLEHYWDSAHPLSSAVSQFIAKPWQPEALAQSLWRALAQRKTLDDTCFLNFVPPDSSSQEVINVLLLEDNPADVDLILDHLSRRTCTPKVDVTTHVTLEGALEALGRDTFCLILADLNVSDSQGLATLSRILAVSDTPVAVISGLENETMALDVMQLGAQDYLYKSEVTQRALHRLIRYSIERQRVHGRYQQLLWQSPDAILVVDDLGKILWANPAANELFKRGRSGRSPLMGKSFGYPITGQGTIEIETGDQCVLEMRQVSTQWLGRFAHIVGLRDITEHKRLQEQLQHEAQHDVLTGLANRALLEDRLDFALRKARRNEEVVALMMLDLDRFKMINDTLGHDAGDALLKQVADKLVSTVRDCDTVARFGGDEFVVLAENIHDAESAGKLAKKILTALEEPFDFADTLHVVTTSIGIALFPKDGLKVKSLMKHADNALYRAKEGGRNLYQFYDKLCHQRAVRNLSLEKELVTAIKEKQFCLHYQPQFSEDGLVGAEALMRWQHPVHGLLPPGQFIPLLENKGLICEVEMWLLGAVCDQLVEWRRQFGSSPRLAINLSVAGLHQPSLVSFVESTLLSRGLSEGALTIEISERSVLKDTLQTSRTLSGLANIGVSAALDDFGTGASALNYLRELPSLNTLKLDRSLTLNASGGERDLTILKTFIQLAHSLEMNVIAEGVETMSQLAGLHALHCDAFQGYLFAPPLEPIAWRAFFQQWQEAPGHFSHIHTKQSYSVG